MSPKSRVVGSLLALTLSACASAGAHATPTWTQVGGTSPSARTEHSMIYDSYNRRAIVFGGEDADGVSDSVWAFSLDSLVWHPLHTAGTAPVARTGHSAAYDPSSHRMLIFGGVTDDSFSDLNDVWQLTLPASGAPTWTPLKPNSSQCFGGGSNTPCQREGHASVWIAGTGMVFQGGQSCPRGLFNLQDTWTLEDTTWHFKSGGGASACNQNPVPLSSSAPDPRTDNSLIFDSLYSRLVVYGGYYDQEGDPSNYWVSTDQGATWTKWNNSPNLHASHSAIYDSRRQRMVVYGGISSDSYLSETDSLTLPASGHGTWGTMSTSSPPAARASHRAIYDPCHDRMVVFGGELSGETKTNETWLLDFSTDATAPAAVADLGGITGTTTSILMGWTAPADDAGSGCFCKKYDLRYSTSTITSGNFASASVATNTMAAGRPGSADQFNVTGLTSGTLYYFALKTQDFAGNWSAISNVTCARPGISVQICHDELRAERGEPSTAPTLELRQVRPNPAAGRFTVRFSLPDSRPASITLLDIAGRKLQVVDVGRLGLGEHDVQFGADIRVPPGHYIVRLRHGEETRSATAILLQ